MGTEKEDVEIVCSALELDWEKCRFLTKWVNQKVLEARTEAASSGVKTKPKKPRELSAWQQCIISRRKGKPFDPQAIKELAKEYKAGKCPP